MRALRVLVVDDEFQMLRAARTVLHEHDTYIASDIETAVSVASHYEPDAILLDVLLADESGFDAIEPLLKVSPRSVVVMMTGSSSMETMRVAYASGADGFVPKYALKAVLAVLDDLLSSQPLEAEQ